MFQKSELSLFSPRRMRKILLEFTQQEIIDKLNGSVNPSPNFDRGEEVR
jgi:hypothetical protein